ncbi:MAG TPA: amino acid ABC transporter permease [Stellaceae bacterium]|nr:amino acid ABC transporter permease [Stellaceae bacterium]
MTDIANELPAPTRRSPTGVVRIVGWLRANLFSSVFNSILTLLCVVLLVVALRPMIRWAVIDAIWEAPNGAACHGGGACWAFIGEKFRFILFGFFPTEELWRPVVVVVIFLLMILAACARRTWGGRLAVLWVAGLAAVYLLMHGGILGLGTVETRLWSGLPLTLIIAIVGMVFAFPLAILLALGRRSRLPAVRAICVGYIELIRGVPLITFLFMASLMLPLFLPTGMTVDKLLRAQIAFILFAAAYLAEVIRGGLQAIPHSQTEAAEALGLRYWQRTRLIVLPQALALVIPPLVNTFIGIFKDTTLVIIISLFDLLGTAEAALSDVNWQGFYIEDYTVIASIYFCFCFFMSRYSQMLEREFNRGTRR